MLPLFGERSPNWHRAMVGLREAVGNSVRSFMCAAASIDDPWGDYIANATSGIPGVGAVTGAVDNVNDFWTNLLCPQAPPSNPPTYPPPSSTAGQCPVPYSISAQIQIVRADGSISATSSVVTVSNFSGSGNQIIGPIGGPNIVPFTSGTQSRARLEYTGSNSSGNPETGEIFDSPLPPGGAMEVLLFQPNRLDGMPDDCGGDSVQPPPTGDDDITYDGPDGNPVDVTININPSFPVFSPNGDLTIPIIVGFPTFDLGVDFNLSTGDININFGGEPGAEECCPPVDEVDDDMGDEDDPPPPDDDKRLWGIKVNCDPSASNEVTEVGGSTTSLSLWLPDLGIVRFAVSIGGYRAWTPAQKIQTLSQFVPVNAPSTAYAYDILPRRGVTIAPTEVIVKGTDE